MFGIPTPWLVGGAIVAALIWTGSVYVVGRGHGSAACQAKVAAAIAAEQRRQGEAIDASLENARREAEKAEAENIIREEKVRTYEAEVASRPDACVIGDDDARRLRDIR